MKTRWSESHRIRSLADLLELTSEHDDQVIYRGLDNPEYALIPGVGRLPGVDPEDLQHLERCEAENQRSNLQGPHFCERRCQQL